MAHWVVPCGKWPSAELYDWGGVSVSKVVKKGLFDAKVHLMPILSCPHVTSESPNLLLSGWYTTILYVTATHQCLLTCARPNASGKHCGSLLFPHACPCCYPHHHPTRAYDDNSLLAIDQPPCAQPSSYWWYPCHALHTGQLMCYQVSPMDTSGFTCILDCSLTVASFTSLVPLSFVCLPYHSLVLFR